MANDKPDPGASSTNNPSDGQAQPASFLAAIAPGGQAPQGTMITGYLGDSGQGGKTKLYRDPNATIAVEFDPADILTTQALSGQLPGYTAVWLRHDAVVTVTPSMTGTLSSFLQGSIISGAMGQGGPQGLDTEASGGMAPAFLSIFSCGGGGGATHYDSFFWCRSRFFCNPQSLSCLC